MKKFISFFIFCASFHFCWGQVTVTKTRISTDNKNDHLHKIANEFSDEVGDKLKEMYPAKVKSITVKLDTLKGKMRLQYSAEIVKCDTAAAQYYFDHRGALSAAKKSLDAVHDAWRRRQSQKLEAMDDFKRIYGDVVIADGATSQTFYAGYFWVVCEVFIAANKKSKK